jgi:hypothetical protein
VFAGVLDVEFIGEGLSDLHLFLFGVADYSHQVVLIHLQHALHDGLFFDLNHWYGLFLLGSWLDVD